MKEVSQACICIMGYGNRAQPLCCEGWPPGFLTPWQGETWAHIPCICTPWLLQGLAKRELPSALLGTWPEPSRIPMAHQGHLPWRLNSCFPPISVIPSSKEFKYVNASCLFWKAYKHQIAVDCWTGFLNKDPPPLCQLGQCSIPSKGRKILSHAVGRN